MCLLRGFVMESIATIIAPYMETFDILNLSFTNSGMYVHLYPYVDTLYIKFVKSDYFKKKVIDLLNYKANIINQFKYNTEISNKYMYEYLILCYENWIWLSIDEYKKRLSIPKSSLYIHFLSEKKLDMKSVLPDIKFVYTHIHRPTKQFTFYTHLRT